MENVSDTLKELGFEVTNMNIPYARYDSRCWSIAVTNPNNADVCIVVYHQNRGELGCNNFDILHTRSLFRVSASDLYEKISNKLSN